MGERQGAGRVVGGVIAIVLVVGGLVGGYTALLYAFNPVGDEWHCMEGQAPAGRDGFYNECFGTDRELPDGYTWDPYGNRPMAYNCDKDGWILVARPYTRRGVTEYERDCVREGIELPRRWRMVERS